MKQAHLKCSCTDKRTNQRWSPTSTHHGQGHENLKLCSLGKIPSWEALGSQEDTDFLGWQICLWGEIFNSLSSFVQKGQIENKVRVENWVRYYFPPSSPQLSCDLWDLHSGWLESRGGDVHAFLGFRTTPCIVFSILPWCLAVILTHSSSRHPFKVGWNYQKWFVPSENRTLTLPVVSILLCMSELHLLGISK